MNGPRPAGPATGRARDWPGPRLARVATGRGRDDVSGDGPDGDLPTGSERAARRGAKGARLVDRVVVVGGGILGMMHAVQARSAGLSVVHLEREAGARGASVRNFGLIWVSGRAPGAELALAQRARTLWEELAGAIPAAGFRPLGSLTVACDEAELGLLKEAAAMPDAAERGFELLDAAAAAELNPALRGEFAGALLCRRDAIVEPREVPGAIRDYLLAGHQGQGSYDWLPGRQAMEVAPHAVRDHTGTWHRGDLVVLCTGAAHTGIAGPHLAGFERPPVRRVRLQMLQTEPFEHRLTTSVADGDSLRYYPAFDLPGRAQARAAGASGRGGRCAAADGSAAGRQPHHWRYAQLRGAVPL